MARFGVAGNNIALSATCAAILWNPHASISLYVVYINFVTQGTSTTTQQPQLRRATARGTASTTVTPDVDNHYARQFAPISGAVLDVAWSAVPTLDASVLRRINVSHGMTQVGQGWEWDMSQAPYEILPGEGLAIALGAGASTGLVISFTWDE